MSLRAKGFEWRQNAFNPESSLFTMLRKCMSIDMPVPPNHGDTTTETVEKVLAKTFF